MIRKYFALVLCSVFLTGCAMPARSILIIRADAVVLLPPAPTVVNAEYRCCGEEVPPEVLAQAQPSSNALVSVLKLKP